MRRDEALAILAAHKGDLLTHHVYTSELKAMYEGLLHRRDEFLGVTLHW